MKKLIWVAFFPISILFYFPLAIIFILLHANGFFPFSLISLCVNKEVCPREIQINIVANILLFILAYYIAYILYKKFFSKHKIGFIITLIIAILFSLFFLLATVIGESDKAANKKLHEDFQQWQQLYMQDNN